MEYQLGAGYCEEDVIQLCMKNIRIVGFGIIGCSECPFSSPHKDTLGQDDINIADPDEGHYDCGLIGQIDFWGEDPICNDENWREWFKYIMVGD